MPDLGKTLIIIGLVIAAVGVYLSLGGKLLPFGRLPGDIHIERDNYSVYFPLGSCLLVSVLLSLIFWLFRK